MAAIDDLPTERPCEDCEVWWEPSYSELKMVGRLANTIVPWGLLDSPVTLAVLDTDEAPYCVASTDDDLTRVLTHSWPPEDVLPTLP